jgi:hypothetical protein
MNITVIVAALLFAVAGIALIAKRRAAADVQALLAGGRMPAGCAVAEGIALMALAALVVIAFLRGWV